MYFRSISYSILLQCILLKCIYSTLFTDNDFFRYVNNTENIETKIFNKTICRDENISLSNLEKKTCNDIFQQDLDIMRKINILCYKKQLIDSLFPCQRIKIEPSSIYVNYIQQNHISQSDYTQIINQFQEDLKDKKNLNI